MIAVLLLVCVAVAGACVRMMIDGIADMRRPKTQRIHPRKNPRLLIWGMTGFLFSSVVIFAAFPLEPALALIGLSLVAGTMTAIAGKFKILGWD
jgi:heme/copper-type cytochrome/quinol oxidase subunit 3